MSAPDTATIDPMPQEEDNALPPAAATPDLQPEADAPQAEIGAPQAEGEVPQVDQAEPVAVEDEATDEEVKAHSELLRTDEYSEYLLHSPREIMALLRQVTEHGDLITIYFNEGKDFLLTTLIQYDENHIYLDKGSSSEMNRKALDAPKLFCVTRHAKVKLQFLLQGVEEVALSGSKVFRAALPETILRLQRREFYRLSTPITRPLICHVPIRFADGRIENVDVNVVDISAGGVAMLAPPEGIAFEEEMEFPNCALELPEMGVITATLQVRSIFETTLRNGSRLKRAGCSFINIPPAAQNMIQRYIIRIERERKARESGLA